MTREQFNTALQQLQTEGKPITRNGIVRALGGGSKKHAAAYLAEWCEQNYKAPAATLALAPDERAPLPAAKAAFERALEALQDHERRRPRENSRLQLTAWRAFFSQFQGQCVTSETRWRALDWKARQAWQVLLVSRSRVRQGRRGSDEHQAHAEAAEATLLALCGEPPPDQTLEEHVQAILAAPRIHGKATLPPLI